MLGCHFAREDVVNLQKGLRFRFLESHNLEKNIAFVFHFSDLNSDEVMVVE